MKSTTTTEMFFQLPEYNGKEYTLSGKIHNHPTRGNTLLARLSPDGKLFIAAGYQWDSPNCEMILSSLVLDTLRQMYRVNHGYFAYSKPVIHEVYNSNMKQEGIVKWKRLWYYSLCKVRCCWKQLWYKWRA